MKLSIIVQVATSTRYFYPDLVSHEIFRLCVDLLGCSYSAMDGGDIPMIDRSTGQQVGRWIKVHRNCTLIEIQEDQKMVLYYWPARLEDITMRNACHKHGRTYWFVSSGQSRKEPFHRQVDGVEASNGGL